MQTCTLCKHRFKDYQNRERTRCGPCNTKIRRFRVRAAAIEYLGNKCAECGWQGNQAVFQFHRRNSSKKDFSITRIANKSWNTIESELKKCILLCANCHSILHSTQEQKIIDAIKNNP